MNFYNLSEIKPDKKSLQSIKSDGIAVDLMSEIFMQLSKDPKYQTVDSVAGLELCYCDIEHSIKEDDAVVKSGEVKKRSTKAKYAFVKKNSILELQVENEQIIFFTVVGQTLHASSDKKVINKLFKTKSEMQFPSEGHRTAYAWLEHGEVGQSALTLCAAMFPDLKHETLQKYIARQEVNYPHDFADFGRCYKFISSIPEGHEKLKFLVLGTEWSNIISNWSSIESGYISEDKSDQEASYNLLQRCIGRPPKNKKHN